jgi:hypothetical protein
MALGILCPTTVAFSRNCTHHARKVSRVQNTFRLALTQCPTIQQPCAFPLKWYVPFSFPFKSCRPCPGWILITRLKFRTFLSQLPSVEHTKQARKCFPSSTIREVKRPSFRRRIGGIYYGCVHFFYTSLDFQRLNDVTVDLRTSAEPRSREYSHLR